MKYILKAWKYYAKGMRLIIFNIKAISIFVVIFTVFNLFATIAYTELQNLFLMKVTGQTYIETGNAMKVYLNPVAIIMIVIGYMLMATLALFEISGILFALYNSIESRKISFLEIIDRGIYCCRSFLNAKHWKMFCYILLILPLSDVLAFSGVRTPLTVPEFIRDYIQSSTMLFFLARVIYFAVILVAIRYIFSFNFHILGNTYEESCKNSATILRNKEITVIVSIIFQIVIMYIFAAGIGGVVSSVAMKVASWWSKTSGTISLSYSQISIMKSVETIFKSVCCPVANLALITVLWNELSKKKEIRNDIGVSLDNAIDPKTILADRAGFVLCALVIGISNIFIFRTDVEDLTEFGTRPMVVAHRGDSVRAPENTLDAFKIAVTEKIDQIELDVQQTKDGVIIVSHDDNIKRVSGKDLYIHDLTYEETQELDVGSWFSPLFSDVRFSTLDEVLEFMQDYPNIELQIEIKPTGYENNIEEAIIDIIKENGAQNRCMIGCFKLPTLERIKQIDPSIQTLYMMAITGVEVQDIPYADAFSIEQANIDSLIVAKIHSVGKKCYAWTTNTEDTVQDLIDCGVDGIVTDDPVMMNNALDRANYATGFVRGLRQFDKLLTRR